MITAFKAKFGMQTPTFLLLKLNESIVKAFNFYHSLHNKILFKSNKYQSLFDKKCIDIQWFR